MFTFSKRTARTPICSNTIQRKILIEEMIDKSRQSFQPWPNHTVTENGINCSKFRNYFAKNGSFLPTTWLYSYPGSGNTWLRYLIEGATGFFTRGPDPIVSVTSLLNVHLRVRVGNHKTSYANL